uniref:Uncharacterized protein n=1 Tax=Tetranychus urticae TaxID=32264 RepID=T1KZE4_TETUR
MILYFISVILLLIVNLDVCTSSKSCSPNCFASVYSLSNNAAKSECTSRADCLVKATFRVIQRGAFDEAINLTVIAYGINTDTDRSVAFALHNSNERIEYWCQSPRNGKPQAKVVQGSNSTFLEGNAQNISNALVCHWTFGKDDYIWPTHANYSKINLLNNLDYQISLVSDDVTKTVAWDLSKLPIYRMNFLRCCYKPHGGSDYLFLSNQTSQNTNFYLQAFPPVPKSMTVTLTNPNGGEFSVTCNSSNTFNASVKVDSQWEPIRDLRYYEIVKRDAPFPDFRCFWSQPVVLAESSGSLDTRDAKYNLEISSDNKPTYSESTVALNGASHSLFANLALILFSILFYLIL